MYQLPNELKSAYEHSALSFVLYEMVDGAPVPILFSDGFCKYTGKRREQLADWLTRGMPERIHPKDLAAAQKVLDDFFHKRGNCDVIFRCKSDSAGAEDDPEAAYTPLHRYGEWQTMPDGTELALVGCADFSASWTQLKEQADLYTLLQNDRFYKDPLTELPNINYLHEFGGEKISQKRAEGKTPHLVYADVYALQAYNNRYGHKEGDRLLCLIAQTLKNTFPNALVARGEDDSFVLITWLDTAEEIVARLHDANQAVRAVAAGKTAGFRSGICLWEADLSLSKAHSYAKRALTLLDNDMTRDAAFFSPEAKKRYYHERYIVEHIDLALECGWINIYYHALYRVKNRKIAAFEALARWGEPSRDVITPDGFIPILLKYHLLYKLDLYIFEQVCKQQKLWYELGLPLLPVSVNFSRQDFRHINLVAEMDRIYEKCGLAGCVDKKLLVVEVTEQALASNADVLATQLDSIREAGYQLWLDDFGSEYSAINMLSRFHFDLIKCDMELLRHLDDRNGLNRFILKELVYVCRQLNMKTLIEGLETAEHLAFVEEIGGDLAQGYYYHRPEMLEDILHRIQTSDYAQLFETDEDRAAL